MLNIAPKDKLGVVSFHHQVKIDILIGIVRNARIKMYTNNCLPIKEHKC